MSTVLVTTQHRGVFVGDLSDDQDRSSRTLDLTNCRNVIYWSAPTSGFLGLAADGPGEGSRLGKAATGPVKLHDVTSVTECSAGAADRLRAWPAAS